MHCGSKEIVESYFLSTIKEADTLKHKGKVSFKIYEYTWDFMDLTRLYSGAFLWNFTLKYGKELEYLGQMFRNTTYLGPKSPNGVLLFLYLLNICL